MEYPSISIIIPAWNSAWSLKDCLDSIAKQDYPRDKLEIVIVDAGSSDTTVDIAKEFTKTMNMKIIDNPLKTGEAGKATGLKCAQNEITAFIDSDNILPDQDWLKAMVSPFTDADIVASEPLYYTFRKQDPCITRYSALLGMNDPLCLFLGNYDRYCLLTGRWTEVPRKEIDKDNYLEVCFLSQRLPTIGANGFLIRRKEMLKYPLKDYLFDIDVIGYLYSLNPQLKIAKVKTGIIHIFSRNVFDFIAKQQRRFRDYAYYKALGLRSYKWEADSFPKTVKFVLYTLFCLPVLLQALRGYILKRDRAWLFHPIACWITLCVYGFLSLQNLISPLKPKKR